MRDAFCGFLRNSLEFIRFDTKIDQEVVWFVLGSFKTRNKNQFCHTGHTLTKQNKSSAVKGRMYFV